MNWRRTGAALAVLVLIGTALVAVGIGQGNAPHRLPITAAARAREVRAVNRAGRQVRTGEVLFNSHGCDACHAMAAGDYSGRLGPRLDVQSQGDSANAVLQNITHPPDDDKGYEAGLMPENLARRLSAHDLAAFAAYIHTAAAAAKG